MWTIIVLGSAAFLFSAINVTRAQFDIRFLFLALTTICIGSRITIQIPRLSSHISVSDTFIFLSMLLFGGDVAIMLAAVEALCCSVRLRQMRLTITFNTATAALSTFVTVWVLRVSFGSIFQLRGGYSAPFIVGICLMALVQYVANSGLVATAAALKINQPLWTTWRKSFLWTSITYFAGASAAGIIAKLIDAVGFYAFLVDDPDHRHRLLHLLHLPEERRSVGRAGRAGRAPRRGSEGERGALPQRLRPRGRHGAGGDRRQLDQGQPLALRDPRLHRRGIAGDQLPGHHVPGRPGGHDLAGRRGCSTGSSRPTRWSSATTTSAATWSGCC